MKKKALALFSSLGNVPEDMLEDALQPKPKRQMLWHVIALAACLCAVTVAVFFWSQPEEPSAPAASGGAGHEAGSVFMSYAGPVLPLTAMMPLEGVKVTRNIAFSFVPDADGEDGPAVCQVGDGYILSNPTHTPIYGELVYPFVGSFRLQYAPVLYVDGKETEYRLFAGTYSGGFQGPMSVEREEGSLNLKNIDSWQGYNTLLSQGNYWEKAVASFPKLEQKVTVYELTDITDGGYPSTSNTLAMAFHPDANTRWMSFGFNGSGEMEDGTQIVSMFIPGQPACWSDGQPRLLLVLEGDIGPWSIQGYSHGGCEEKDKIDCAGAQVKVYEATLGDVVEYVARYWYDACVNHPYDGDANRFISPRISFEMYYGEVCRMLDAYSSVGYTPMERYSGGTFAESMLMQEVMYQERILYAAVPVEIPAGGCVEVKACLTKPGSFDLSCVHTENKGVYGYDMLTHTGSVLVFSSQQASLAGAEHIQIVRQNFGFDPQRGILEVPLQLDEKQYYLEVKER